MKKISYWVLIAGVAICHVAEATSYIPIGSPLSAPARAQSRYLPVKAEARPFLPGTRPVELELLEDALRWKMSGAVGESRGKAHKKIIRMYLHQPAYINGHMAEALFLEKNPQWGYVGKMNAPLHDIYMRIPGRKPPYNAQIKTHASGDSEVYAKDMKKDHSGRFLVPDDHVRSLRDHWRGKLLEHEAAGRTADAIEARRQLGRIQGLGFTMKYISNSTARAARYALREQNAGYISFGAAAAMALGPDLWNWWSTGSLTDQTMLRAAHMGSIIATQQAATFALSHNAVSTRPVKRINTSTLSKLGNGSLRGGIRGNAFVGLTMLATDTAWSIYEHGGARAFQNEEFYTNLGGSVGSLLGLAVSLPVTAVTVNPIAGFLAGLSGGSAGDISGRVAMKKILEAVGPEFIHKAEDTAITDAQNNIKESISRIQRGLDS